MIDATSLLVTGLISTATSTHKRWKGRMTRGTSRANHHAVLLDALLLSAPNCRPRDQETSSNAQASRPPSVEEVLVLRLLLHRSAISSPGRSISPPYSITFWTCGAAICLILDHIPANHPGTSTGTLFLTLATTSPS